MKNLAKTATTLALSALFFSSAGLPAQASHGVPFTDVAGNNNVTFATEINWLHENGIANGWSDGTFRPLELIDRGQMAAFMYRMAGSPQYTPPSTPVFQDVSPNNAFYKEIHWMESQGITNGWKTPGGKPVFKPYSPIMRDQMAAFLYRFAGEPVWTPPAMSPFRDVNPTHVFYKEIAWVEATDIANGWRFADERPVPSPDKRPYYGPNHVVTREQMAAFLYRLNGVLASAVSPANSTIFHGNSIALVPVP